MPDHRRLVQIFAAAADLPEGERESFLRDACGEDTALRAEVEALLRCDAEGAGLLDGPALGSQAGRILARAMESSPEPEVDLAAGEQRIGRYRLLKELGRGAMGRVYLAKQDGTQQLVALKLIREPLATRKSIRRFEHEAEMLGRLHDPGIARIHEAGVADTGSGEQPFFAMEYVRGVNLIEHARRQKLGVREKLSLLAALCDSVHHAHSQGVVHRDLKPDNVLVTPAGAPRILDFGVARLIDSDIQLTTLHTNAQVLIGTLSYMSPEQAGGDPRDIDGRSDVYALGVLAYELLSGALPLDLGRASLLEAVRAIQEDKPRRLRALESGIPEDVETIVVKAMEKEKGRRYQSAAAFGDDLRRFLADEPIQAHPPSAVYLLSKFTRRHRIVVVSAATVLIAMVAAAGFSVRWALRAENDRNRAELQTYKLSLEASAGDLLDGSRATAQARLEAAPEHHRGWEWRHLANLADQSDRVMRGHEFFVWNVATSPDGTRAYSCGGDATVRVWNLADGQAQRVLRDHDGRVFSVAVSSDGQRMASGSVDCTVRLRDTSRFETIAVLEGHKDAVFGLAFSPDGTLLASGANNGTLRLWDGHTGELVRVLEGHDKWIWSLAFSPDGSRLATASVDGTVGLWDVESGVKLAALRDGEEVIVAVAFSPTEDKLVCGTLTGRLQVWDLRDGSLSASLAAHADCIGTVAYSPDGRFLLTASRDETIGVWGGVTLEPVTVLEGHTGFVRSVAFDRGGTRIVSCSWDNTIRVWDPRRLEGCPPRRAREGVCLFECGLRSDTLVIVDKQGKVTLEELYTSASLEALLSLDRGPWFVGSGGRVIADTVAGRPRLRLPRNQPSLELPRGRLVGSSADAGMVVVATPDHDVVVCPTGGGTPILLQGHTDRILSAAFDPIAKRLVSGGYDYTLRVWDLQSGECQAILTEHRDIIREVRFHPSGRWFASASNDGSVVIWDENTWDAVASLPDHGGGACAIAFSADGARLAVGSHDGSVHIWSVDPWERLYRIRECGDTCTSLVFTADNSSLVCTHSSGRLIVLDGR